VRAQSWFHGACGLLLVLSAWSFLSAPAATGPALDPPAQLRRFLAASGLEVTDTRRLIGNELVFDIKAPGCNTTGQVLLLPSIHRISDEAWAAMRQRPDAIFVHAGQIISGLSPTVLIPRWMIRRALVNLQIEDEDPWISIAVVVLPGPACHMPELLWGELARS